MRLLMGISKDRHGTYYARKKVPAGLQEAVARVLGNGKARQTWLKRSLGTKDITAANKLAKAVLIEFDNTLDRAKGLTVKRAQRQNLSPVEIKRMAEYHYAGKLVGHDDYLRTAPDTERAFRDENTGEPWAEPVPEFGLSGGQMLEVAETLPRLVAEAETALAQGNIAHITFQIEQALSAFQVNLDQKSAAFRELGLALLRAESAPCVRSNSEALASQ